MRLLLAGAILLAGCARHAPLPPAPARAPYTDLKPGQRVTVVTPILKSGGFLVRSAESKVEAAPGAGLNVTMKMDEDFQGYETAVYQLDARSRVRLLEASVSKGGVVTPQTKSIAPRLNVPAKMRYVRLLYTLRVSAADHNMAVLAAANAKRLTSLTERVQSDPAGACRSSAKEYCEWVPAGIAVRPDR
jgi:hypothetical protein